MTSFLFAILFAFQAASAGQNIAGTVVNASTGRPLPHQAISLVALQNGMQTVASTSTDDAGRYRFSASTSGPVMVQSDWQGVPYFAKVATGQSETNLQAYNVSHDAKLVAVDAEIMVLQPNAGQLAIVNEYRIENNAQPPVTLAVKGAKSGLFRFRVPPGAQVDMVRVVGPGEMPLARQPEPTAEHDVYAVPTPLRPGETRVQISYRLPYAGLKAALSEAPVFRPAHFEVYVPQPMSFTGDGFAQVGEQDGYKVYGIPTGPGASTGKFNVSGDAPMPAPPSAEASSPAASSTAQPAPAGGEASASAAPAPAAAVPDPTFLERNRWTLFALLGLVAAAGFGILLARNEPATVRSSPAANEAGSPPPPPPNDLSKLKDDLFLLEVRRNTGNVDEAEYARLRAALDERLRTLARG